MMNTCRFTMNWRMNRSLKLIGGGAALNELQVCVVEPEPENRGEQADDNRNTHNRRDHVNHITLI